MTPPPEEWFTNPFRTAERVEAVLDHRDLTLYRVSQQSAEVYEPACGSIRLGGEDMRKIQLNSLRQSICYLPRDPAIFDGSIASNLRFVLAAASEHELDEVIQLVGLSALVASLPHGLPQRIGPDGCQLSGGERQRLALARAFLQKPRVLILD